MKTFRTFAFAMIASLVAGMSVQAQPTVTFSLVLDEFSPNTFNVYASSSLGDNFGIAFYNFPLLGDILSLDHNSPVANALLSGPPFFTALGFNVLRSADNVTNVLAAQDTIGTSTLVYGIGQTPGNLATLPGVTSLIPVPEQPSYGAPVLLASGTYGQVAPSFNTASVDLLANVFVSPSTRQVIAANVTTEVVPEVGTLVMSGLGLAMSAIVVIRRRRSA